MNDFVSLFRTAGKRKSVVSVDCEAKLYRSELAGIFMSMTMTLKQFATKGGHERAKKLSKARRIEIARAAGRASGEARRVNNIERASKLETCQSDKTGENKNK